MGAVITDVEAKAVLIHTRCEAFPDQMSVSLHAEHMLRLTEIVPAETFTTASQI